MKKFFLGIVFVCGCFTAAIWSMPETSPYNVSWEDLHSKNPFQIKKNYVSLKNHSQGTLISEKNIEIYQLKKSHTNYCNQIFVTYNLRPGIIYHKLQDQFLQLPRGVLRLSRSALLEKISSGLIAVPNAVPTKKNDKKLCVPGLNHIHMGHSLLVEKNEWSEPYYALSGYAKLALGMGSVYFAHRFCKFILQHPISTAE